MDKPKFIQQISEQFSKQVGELLNNNYTKDMENNFKAILASIFSKLDLVTREEFEVQQQVLAHTRQKLEELELRVDELLNQSKENKDHDTDITYIDE